MAAATIVETMGSNHAAVMDFSSESWRVIIAKGRDMQIVRAIVASSHQSVHASVIALWPHMGTQTKTIMLIIVASPMGKVPVVISMY